MRCLSGVTTSREKKYNVKILKKAYKDYDVKLVVQLVINDQSEKKCTLCAERLPELGVGT